jgi:hypothetical protein
MRCLIHESKVPISGCWIHLILEDYDTLYKLSDFQCLKVFASNLNYCYTKVYAQELR